MCYNKLPGEKYIYLLLYVDDMLIASKNRSTINKLKKVLPSKFEMKDTSEAKKVLGMEIEQDRKCGKINLTQKGHFEEGTSKIQYQQPCKVYKYTISSSF